MTAVTASASDEPAGAGQLEGYLAFGLMVLFWTSDWWYGKVQPPGPAEYAIGIGMMSLWLLFALSGARRGRGLAHAAAVVALLVFGLQTLAILTMLACR